MEKWVVSNDLFFADVVKSLHEGRTVTIPVKGYSMLPFIRGGKDLVELEVPSSPLKPYDIVLFHVGTEDQGKWIMHRILKVDGPNLTIQGDGVTRGREHVNISQVHARAKTILRAGKTPVNPYTRGQLTLVRCWNFLRPLRPFILKAYRLLPWNYGWLKENR
ncbi:MAG: S24/S26 family peptidase [Bacteroidales bacterium]|nr:S24/S26 family peptidase [Bacteroidales bacterium]